ncbi:hypothetical protein KY360_05170 [Candidatus Woesearchaeota archaeon]|nr:hypothetical protein [Candidatus Woesearchaeota archaeon]
MTLKIRRHRNSRKGTELTFAYISIEDAKNMRERPPTDWKRNPNYNESLRNEVVQQLQEFEEGKYLGMVDYLKYFAWSSETEETFLIYESDGTARDPYLTFRRVGRNILILPTPVIHNIGGHMRHQLSSGELISHSDLREEKGLTQFDDLISIIREGFSGIESWEGCEENCYVKREKRHRINYKPSGLVGMEKRNKGITHGDIFSLEVFPERGLRTGCSYAKGFEGYHLEKARPEDISSINIQLAEGSSEKEIHKKMEFYTENLKPFDIPYRFFTVREDDGGHPIYTRIFPKNQCLEEKVSR